MALSGLIEWDVASTGADTNGGGFKTGASGVDHSQQDAAQWALTTATSAGAGNTLLDASAHADMVGNLAWTVSGTNLTASSFFEVTSVSAGVSITFSTNNAGTAIATGIVANGTLNIGGRLATLGAAMVASGARAGNTVWVKGSLAALTATITLTNSGDSTDGAINVTGYTTSHGDGGHFTLTSATNSVALVTLASADRHHWKGFNFTHTAATRGNGFVTSVGASVSWVIEDFSIDGCLNGISFASTFALTGQIFNGEVENCTVRGLSLLPGGTGIAVRNVYTHDNTSDGMAIDFGQSGFATVERCTFDTNGGQGLEIPSAATSWSLVVDGCNFYNNTSDGLLMTRNASAVPTVRITNNIFCLNGGYGINSSAAGWLNYIEDYNAFGSGGGVANASGARQNITAGDNDVTVTALPWTDAANGDFSLNATAGGGPVVKAAGTPGTLPGMTGTGYADMGVLQHQDSGGSGGGGQRVIGS